MAASTLLRTARTRAHLTQAELARRAGVTQSVISAYESGRREPAFSTLLRLLRAAGFQPEISLQPLRRSRLQQVVDLHRDELVEGLAALGATNPRLFGSVSRGDDGPESDVDLLVDLHDDVGLFALAAMRREASRILGVEADVVPADSLRPEVARSVGREVVPL